LDRAIARAQVLTGADTPASQVVHRLALRGIQALEADALASDSAREFLIEVADGAGGIDPRSLRSVRDRAWR
jgi:hypothetical protein